VGLLWNRITTGQFTYRDTTVQVVISTVSFLTNPTGSGKTRIVAHLLKQLVDKRIVREGPHPCHSSYLSKYIRVSEVPGAEERNEYRPILVYAHNSTILQQWVNELNRTEVSHVVCDGEASAKQYWKNEQSRPGMVPRVVVVRGTGAKLMFTLPIRWYLIVYDEPDTQPCPHFKTHLDFWHCLFVTATPKNANGGRYGPSSLIKPLLQTVPGQVVDLLSVRTIDNLAQITGRQPEVVDIPLEVQTARWVSVLNGVDAELQQLLHQGDWSGVHRALGVRARGRDSTVDMPSGELVQRVRGRLQDRLEDELCRRLGPRPSVVEDYRNRLATLETRVVETSVESNSVCPVCLEQTLVKPMVTPCVHKFCCQCICTWLMNSHTCPACREALTVDQLMPVEVGEEGKEEKEEKGEDIPRDKISAIATVIQRHSQMMCIDEDRCKVMVFCDSNGGLACILARLQERDIPAVRLMGRKSTRKKALDDFKREGGAQVLLLNSGEEAAGIDGLQTVCNCVVFFHGNMAHNRPQITGRLNRCGQANDVYVYTLEYLHPRTSLA